MWFIVVMHFQMGGFSIVECKAQGTSDHAGIIFGHAGPFSSRDMPGFVQEGPDVRITDIKGLEFTTKCKIVSSLKKTKRNCT